MQIPAYYILLTPQRRTFPQKSKNTSCYNEKNRKELSMSANQEKELPRVFGYVINLDERGSFSADVRDLKDRTLYEVKSDDEEEGVIWQVEDGFMKHARDINGLHQYLIHLDILKPTDRLLSESDFNRVQAKFDQDPIAVTNSYHP
jgi:hypothetical protein